MLLHEWSQLQPWDAGPWYEHRLGPTPLVPGVLPVTPAIEGMLRRANRYADLVGIRGQSILVVEAKVVAEPGAISQLQHYVDLVRTTPLLSQWPGHVIEPVLLWAVDDPIIHQRATANGIRVELYAPVWVADYLASKFYRS